MHGLIDPVYVDDARGRGADDVRRGDIYLSQPVYLPGRHAIRIRNVDPKESRPPEFEIAGRTQDVFQHTPIKWPLDLPWGEALVVSRAKWERPVIVVSDGVASEVLAGPGRSRPSKSYLCVPVYGCDQHPTEVIERIARYQYPNLFYLPKSVRPGFEEGFARFDHLQAIDVGHLRSRKCCLSDDALGFFDEWLIYYLTNRRPAEGFVQLYLDALNASDE
jgi:hypothetical protein